MTAAIKLGDTVRGWQLWTLRPATVVWHFLVTGCALSASVLGLILWHPSTEQWISVVVLITFGVFQGEVSKRVERSRKLVTESRHVNLTSVWTFAAMLLLPPGAAYLVVWLLYAHISIRSWAGVYAPHRQLLSASAVVTTGVVTQLLFTTIGPVHPMQAAPPDLRLSIAVLVTAVFYSLFDAFLFAVGTWTQEGFTVFRRYMSDLGNTALDVTTNCLGGFVVLALLYQPWLLPLVVLPVVILQRAVLVQELEVQAQRDAKTGLLNASTWTEHAEQVRARARRVGSHFALVIMDLDHFKRHNDTHGHPAGDKLLTAVAEVLRANIRSHDHAGRFGGEEFVLLLPDTQDKDAVHVAERIRQQIAALRITLIDGTVVADLTTSAGVALYPTDGDHVADLLEVADRALYVAKEAGRNRVVLAGSC